MAISKWTEEIHECQEGEVAREWCYLHQYYEFYGNLKEFAQLLKYEFEIQHTPNIPQPSPIFDDYLKKHKICFHPDDIRKGKPPSHDLIKNWSKGQNTSCDEKHNWNDRRSSKRNEQSRLADENMAAQLVDDLPYFYNAIKQDMDMVNESVDNSRMMGNLTPHQAESATKAKHHIVDSILKLTGKDKDYKVKADVDSKTEVTHQGVENLLGAFYVSKTEWENRKSEHD